MPDHLFLVRHGESQGSVASDRAKTGGESLITDESVTIRAYDGGSRRRAANRRGS